MKLLVFAADRQFTKASVAFTAMIAKQTRGSVDLLYVASKESARKVGTSSLSATKKRLAGTASEENLKSGDPIHLLCEEIENDGYDAVVVGARRGIGFLQRRLQSLSYKTIKESPIPVLVVRHPHRQLDRILICSGGLDVAEGVIQIGAQFASQLGAKATLLHVSASVPSMYTGLAEMEESVDTLLDTDTPLAQHLRRGADVMAQHGLAGEVKLEHGVVVDAILQEAEQGNYGLIVLGATQATSSLKGWTLGNVTQQIFERTRLPVLIAKHV